MSYDCTIKFARAYDTAALCGPALGTGEVYAPGGMKFLPTLERVPVLVDHDPEREIGVVKGFFTIPWIDQKWIAADCTITDPPGWLKRGTRASFGYRKVGHYDLGGWRVFPRTFVHEVSVLAAKEPAEPEAQVMLLREASPKVSSFGHGEMLPAPEWTPEQREWVAQGKGGVLRRPATGRVLGVR